MTREMVEGETEERVRVRVRVRECDGKKHISKDKPWFFVFKINVLLLFVFWSDCCNGYRNVHSGCE